MADQNTTIPDETIQDLYRAGDGVVTIANELGIPVDEVWAALNRGTMDSYHSERFRDSIVDRGRYNLW